MILVDTSVWIDHLRNNNTQLAELLSAGLVITHPFVLGELSCDNLKNRVQFLTYLRALPEASRAREEEVSQLIEQQQLWGKGLGWIDAHLLSSALLSRCGLWSLDRQLGKIGTEMRIQVEPHV